MKLIIHTDGGARGNPGPAAVGVVIEPINPIKPIGSINTVNIIDKKTTIQISKRIGETTNNVAEYTAVIEALKEVKNLRQRRTSLLPEKLKVKSMEEDLLEIQFFLDSTLVVNQLNGIFKVKEPNLRNLMMDVKILEQEVGGVIFYNYVPREQNRQADLLVNRALDNY